MHGVSSKNKTSDSRAELITKGLSEESIYRDAPYLKTMWFIYVDHQRACSMRITTPLNKIINAL